jgi:hypothetical protein
MNADLGPSVLDDARVCQLVDGVEDGLSMAEHDPGGALAELGVIAQVVASARYGHRLGHVGDEAPQREAPRFELSGADLVERFLDDTVQRLAGEAEEVDHHVFAVEGGFDIGPDADR